MSRIWIAQHVRPFPHTGVPETAFFVIISIAAAVSLSHAFSVLFPPGHAPRLAEKSIMMEFVTPETDQEELVPANVSTQSTHSTSRPMSALNRLFNPGKTPVSTAAAKSDAAHKSLAARVTDPVSAAPAAPAAPAAVSQPVSHPSAPSAEPASVVKATSVQAKSAEPTATAPSATAPAAPTPADGAAASTAPAAAPLQLQNFNGVAGGDFGAQHLPRVSGNATKLGNIAPYKKDAFTRIVKCFHAHAGKGLVGVYCTIAKDGSLIDSRIVQSSGSDKLDDEVLAATHSATLPPLPEWFTGDEIRIKFVFDCDL